MKSKGRILQLLLAFSLMYQLLLLISALAWAGTSYSVMNRCLSLHNVTQGVIYKVLFFLSPCAYMNKIVGREKLKNKCSVFVYPWFVLVF